MAKRETSESLGIAFTNFDYKGKSGKNYRVSVTVRDGGQEEAEASLLALINIINDVIELDIVDPLPALDEVEPVVFGGSDLGLLEYPPKAGERKVGDVYEITVNEYTNDGAKIQFYAGGEYPLHTHYLGEYGNKVMADVFVPEWTTHFPVANERREILGGDLILRILVSDKVNKKGNPYVNMVNQRRPE
jgi:hypothetical protein